MANEMERGTMFPKRTEVIVSHVPGRLRLRHAALGRSTVNAEVVAEIARTEGVTSVDGNPRTAGVLVHYDAAVLAPPAAEDLCWTALVEIAGLEDGEGFIDDLDLEEPTGTPTEARAKTRPSARTRFAATYRKVRVPVNVAMLATLGGSLLALAVGRRAHAALGVAHLGVLALHLVQYRRRLVS